MNMVAQALWGIGIPMEVVCCDGEGCRSVPWYRENVWNV